MQYREKIWNQFYAQNFCAFLSHPSPAVDRYLGAALSADSWEALKHFFLYAPWPLVEKFYEAVDTNQKAS